MQTAESVTTVVWPRFALGAVALVLIAAGFIAYRAIQNRLHEPTPVIVERDTPKNSVKPSEPVLAGQEKAEPRRASVAPRGSRQSTRQRSVVYDEPVVFDSETTYAKRSEYATEFIPFGSGNAQKTMETGEVIRLQMPRSALITFGLPVGVERADSSVKAELLLGEDGMARAIRFVR